MMSIFEELKRRNVFRVGIAYLVVSWFLLQIIDVVMPILVLPDWVARFIFLLLAVGFIPVLIAAWAFEMTPEGIKKEKDVDRSQSVTPRTGRKLDRAIIIVLVLAVAFLLYRQIDQGSGSISPDTDQPTEIAIDESLNLTPASNGNTSLTIAVLPFINMSSDPEQEYFSDGITEEILNRLAKIRELQVAARTSVFSFKGRDQDIREVGKMLGVGTILEGSVRRDGKQVRITAQLIRASDGFHLWSESYDRKLENIFAIQDDIASQIAAALQVSLGISANPSNVSERLVNPQVYDLYLKARALHRARGTGLIQALKLFQQALDIDPQFAPAWAGLAHSYDVVEFYVSAQVLASIGDFRAKSTAAAQRALQLDPELATALHAMGNNLWVQGEWARAQEYYERALRLDPDSTDIMEDYAHMLLYTAQIEAAIEVAERMLALDPFVPVFLNAAIDIYDSAGNYAKRDKYIHDLTRLNPDFRYTYHWNIMRLFDNRQIDELQQYIDQIDLSAWTSNEHMHAAIDWLTNSHSTPSDEILQALSFRPALAMKAGRPDVFFDLVAGSSQGVKLPGIQAILNPHLPADETQQMRELPATKAFIKAARLPEYWREFGWPDMCRPLSEDDFECH